MPDVIELDVIPICDDRATIRQLLDRCGFSKPLEFGSDGHEHQIRALENLAVVCGSMSQAHQEVLKHNARLCMIENWGWPDFEAREALRAVVTNPGQGGTGPDGLRWYTIPELAELKPTAPLVGDIVMQESLAVLYGSPASGKTFLALDLALSIAAGCAWHGRDVVAGPSAYILAEGRGGIQRRIDAWLQAHGVSDDIPFQLLPEPVDFLRGPDVTELLTSLKEWDPAPRLVVVDMLSQCMPGAVENAQEDMSQFINAAGQLRRTTGATVLVNHHSGWEGKHERGSTVLRGAVDTVMKVVEEDGVITLTCEKQRDAVPFDPIRFRLSPRSQSCTIALAGPEIQGELTASALVALRALENVAGDNGISGPRWLKQCDQKDRTFYRNIKRLQEAGHVQPRGGRYCITERGRALLHDGPVPKNGGTGTPQCHPSATPNSGLSATSATPELALDDPKTPEKAEDDDSVPF
ncbi:MAG: AAA family ATPase [Gemmatimonadetes bacterium]|nr:AAA family ATPase [Gemmatimonadota bacterium]